MPMSEEKAVTRVDPERLRQALVERLPSILPDGMSVERFMAVTLQAIARQPALRECSPASVLMAVLEAAQLGLEPSGAVGGAWLVPMREKGGTKVARLILDYRGIQQLLRQYGGGEVKAVLVYEGDEFEVVEGTEPRIIHRPRYVTRDPAKITHVYAWSLDHPAKFEVMTREEIDRVRARSRAANDGPWLTDYGQMARKTVIKRLAQYLPLRPSVREVLEADTEREMGRPVAADGAYSITAALKERSVPPSIPEFVPPPDDTPQPEPDEEEPEEMAADDGLCGAASPYDDGATCELPAGHAGVHRSGSATW